jgi:hypothetical protein
LATIAPEFDIDPIPKFHPDVNDGQISHDERANRFVIALNAQAAGLSRQTSQLDFEPRDPAVTWRMRFTYAHEFAHRFFFIQSGQKYSRAVDLACAEIREPTKRNAELLKLIGVEERLCNAIAGRILIPEYDLSRRIAGIGRNNSQLVRFGHQVNELSELYGVSREVILVQLQRLWSNIESVSDDTCCFFYLKHSNASGASRRKAMAIRVAIAWLPKYIEGTALSPIFPGLAAENLGKDFSRITTEQMESQTSSHGVFACNLPLLSQDKQALSTVFDGYYETKASRYLMTMLAWGQIKQK